MGFLERSRSLRRKETPFMRKKQDDMPTTQQAKDLDTDRDVQRAIKSAHSHKDSPWNGAQTASSNLLRPRTASRAPTQDMNSQLPPTPSPRNFPDPHTFKLPNGPSRRMSMTPSPRTTTLGLTIHANHSTPGVGFESPRHPKRSMTTPINALPTLNKRDDKMAGIAPQSKAEAASTAPRKEPHLRKSKSGTWRSFFSRKQSKPPIPDFNPADIAPPPALPTPSTSNKNSARSSIHSKVSSKDYVPAVPAKDSKRLDRRSISVDSTRDMQKASTRAQSIKSLCDPAARPRLKLENLSTLEPPLPQSFIRSPSAESTMSQYFDAASHTSGPSMPATPLEEPAQRRLNVNIPAVEMERYSIMFEKLLKPQSSLMERRQTIVKQLKLPNQSSGGVSHRIAKRCLLDHGLTRRLACSRVSCSTTARHITKPQLPHSCNRRDDRRWLPGCYSRAYTSCGKRTTPVALSDCTSRSTHAFASRL